MASNVTRDHHRWTKDITVSKTSPLSITLKDATLSQVTIKSDGAAAPVLELAGQSQEGTSAPIFIFRTQRDTDTSAQVGDFLGALNFIGFSNGSVSGTPAAHTFSQILVETDVVIEDQESGKLSLKVASHDGGLENGLVLTGGSVDTEVDVTIGNGAASMTTIAGNLNIPAETNLYLDGGDNTYIREHAADIVRYVVGGTTMMTMTEAGVVGDTVSFGVSGVGFTQFTAGFDATDTYVRFNTLGNKGHLTMTANIVDVHLHFPNVSCNCQLIVLQDGTGGWDVANWKTFDQAAGNASTVIWSGGSAPGLTETADKLDILSFYWDNTNHKAYGVASTNF